MRLHRSLAGVYNFLRRDFNFDSLKVNKAEQQPLSEDEMKTAQNRTDEPPQNEDRLLEK